MSLPELKPEVIEKLIRMGQPPSVFDATFTKQVLNQIANQSRAQTSRKHPALNKADLVKLQNSYTSLIQIVKMETPETALPVDSAQFADLLNEKLVEMVEGKVKVTELGRQFVRDYEQDHKAKQCQ